MLLLLASVLIMGVVSTVGILPQQQTAYAQSGEGVTVTATCTVQVHDGKNFLFVEVVGDGEREGFVYQTSVVEPSGVGHEQIGGGGEGGGIRTGQLFPAEFGGETFRVTVQEVTQSEWEASGEDAFEGRAPFFDEDVTCPEVELDLTEQFPNQGSCITEANTNPNAGFTKEDCKTAFKSNR